MSNEGDLTTTQLYELLKKSQEEQTEKLTKEIHKNNSEVNKKLEKAEKNIEKLHNKYLFLERKRRKNNIIIFGLKINKTNLILETIETLNSILDINLSTTDINNIYYVGKQEDKKGLIIEFISFTKKLLIFKNIQKLKGRKITISNDLCPEDQEQQKILIKHFKAAKSKGQEAKIKGHKLIIGSTEFTAEELEHTEESSSECYTDVEEEEEVYQEHQEERSEGQTKNRPSAQPQGSNTKAATHIQKVQGSGQKRKRIKKNASPIQRSTRSQKN